jgi:hypothetical protein
MQVTGMDMKKTRKRLFGKRSFAASCERQGKRNAKLFFRRERRELGTR